ncbi:MAG TPA: EAL domain-containing protein [Candidatus Binatia bacterium]|nr:EAL domain-containing protein [Candidatus Binatia bacterium]
MSDDKYRRKLDTGEVLFREGDAGDCAYLIESGRIEVFREVAAGRRETMAELGTGDMVGEMAVLDALPRTASAEAREPSVVRLITTDMLMGKLESADPLVRVMLEVVMKRYRSRVFGQTGDSARQGVDRGKTLSHIQLLHDLDQALVNDRFELHFQPIVHLGNMATAGFEALVRLRTPDGKLVSPGEFIPVMEQEADLAERLGRWVLGQACLALARLQGATRAQGGADPLFMSINLSGREFEAPDLLARLREAVEGAGIAPEQVKLEITESALVGDIARSVELVARCRQLGVKIAIDDFGTGYSSLNYLQQFEVDTLKIDRSFVTPLQTRPDALNILRTIRDLAHGMGMNVVAEGIESPEQARVLGDLGVEYGQGYLFSKPVDEAGSRALLGTAWPWAFDRRSGERRNRRADAGV